MAELQVYLLGGHRENVPPIQTAPRRLRLAAHSMAQRPQRGTTTLSHDDGGLRPACAPYQANRALLQLAEDECALFPKGAHELENNVYVDDALAGGDTLEDALDVRDQLINILNAAGMKLDKWSSNYAALLPDDSPAASSRLFSETNSVSALGLLWKPAHDCFTFRVDLGPRPKTFHEEIRAI